MKTPQAWSEPTKLSASTVAASNLDMTENTVNQGLCPECKNKMIVAYIGDRQVHACVADRVALPLPNKQVVQNEAEAQTQGA